MFELLRLTGFEEGGITLETRLRNRVDNSQAAEPDEHAVRKFRYLLSLHRGWELRKAPCGIYNCFGHVWAARRTAIYEESGVETILRDDGYRALNSSENPRQGDLALYCDSVRGSLLHVGIVCELRGLVASDGTSVGIAAPWILSKLNDVSGEVLHHSKDVPYGKGNFELEFWTDRLT
jgi:hypothetical protein